MECTTTSVREGVGGDAFGKEKIRRITPLGNELVVSGVAEEVKFKRSGEGAGRAGEKDEEDVLRSE